VDFLCYGEDTDIIMHLLGTRLRELRGELSLHEVGKGSNVAAADIRKYETGQYYPTKPTLKKLCDYFEVPYGELRFLYYEDIYRLDSEELETITSWVLQRRFAPHELVVIEKLSQIAQDQRREVFNRIQRVMAEIAV
jgi:transcriptional regulator with XRE-family HTH domain